jgi:hypothetical protein
LAEGEDKLLSLLDQFPSDVIVKIVKKYAMIANVPPRVAALLKTFKKFPPEEQMVFIKLAKEMVCPKPDHGHDGPPPPEMMEEIVEESQE